MDTGLRWYDGQVRDIFRHPSEGWDRPRLERVPVAGDASLGWHDEGISAAPPMPIFVEPHSGQAFAFAGTSAPQFGQMKGSSKRGGVMSVGEWRREVVGKILADFVLVSTP